MIDLMVELMVDLDKNDELMQQYLANPQVVAESYGLNREDIKMLATNDLHALKVRTDAVGGGILLITVPK